MSKDEKVLDNVSEISISVANHCLDDKSLAQKVVPVSCLKDARLAQGMDIATLAGLLKVPVHKLQALEQGRFEALPDPVFTRALASSMCRILKLDSAPVLQQLPAITAFKVTPQNRGINTPFRIRGNRNPVPVWNHASRPAIWLGIALATGALVLMFLPFIEQEFARLQQVGGLEVSPAKAIRRAPVTTTVVIPVIRNDGVVEDLAPGGSISPEVAVVVPAQGTIPALPLSPGIGATSVEPLVTFSAKGTSSVKVTDASGTLVFDRVLRAGESAGLSGTLPLTAVVSHASAIQVRVRGEAFDLGTVSTNNIARFELK